MDKTGRFSIPSVFSVTPFIFQTMIWPIMWVIMRIFGRIRIMGKENIREHHVGAIFAGNHRSELDPMLIPATLNPFSALMPMFYVSRERRFYEKSGLTQYVYGGSLFKLFGAYQVMVKEKEFEMKLRNHIEILEGGHSVCLFPEGHITETGEVGEGHPGVAYLLWRTGRPVIPVAIYGHYKMSRVEFFKKKRALIVSYGTPITREEMFGEVVRATPPSQGELIAVTKIIMARIRNLHAEVSKTAVIKEPKVTQITTVL